MIMYSTFNSQVKIGMDLTRVALPTFILERRSLLEMYADFFAHPDLFCSIVNYTDPKDRMVQVLRWYLSAFHAGRKSEVARKPYNPIIGEVFRCYWDLPDDTNQASKPLVPDGPVPWATSDQLSFVAEQVSHHPPVSAFYAEHKEKRISFCGHIWTKSKFLGLSVCVNNIGQGCVSLLDLDEEYILNFPSGYGRSILTVPWVELGGTCQITCSKTGYSATVEFLTKPFYGGKKHRISAEAWSPGEKKPFLVVEGEWNGNMIAKWNDGMTENKPEYKHKSLEVRAFLSVVGEWRNNINRHIKNEGWIDSRLRLKELNKKRTEGFIDTLSLPIIKKCVKPVTDQEENESRFLWKEVTAGLK
ncbi:Oxysterol-binding protein-related protein 9 [Armadillidium vulgare]|nr:Oxysterol-binding protein-related protein 9 [Armadillidium vulgare]